MSNTYKNSKKVYTQIKSAQSYFLNLHKDINNLDYKTKEKLYNDYLRFTKLNNINNDEKTLLKNVIETQNWSKSTIENNELIEKIKKDFDNNLINEIEFRFPISKYLLHLSSYKKDDGFTHIVKMNSNFKETIYNIVNVSKKYCNINMHFIDKIIIEYEGHQPNEIIIKKDFNHTIIQDELSKYKELEQIISVNNKYFFNLNKHLIEKKRKNESLLLNDLEQMFIGYYKKYNLPEYNNKIISITFIENTI